MFRELIKDKSLLQPPVSVTILGKEKKKWTSTERERKKINNLKLRCSVHIKALKKKKRSSNSIEILTIYIFSCSSLLTIHTDLAR